MARKLKNVGNETKILYDLAYGKKTFKNMEYEKCTLKDLEYGRKNENHGK
jgi:hypothetical protein